RLALRSRRKRPPSQTNSTFKPVTISWLELAATRLRCLLRRCGTSCGGRHETFRARNDDCGAHHQWRRRALGARLPAFARLDLLRDLAADFAALIRFRVDVDVVLAGDEIGGLRIGE